MRQALTEQALFGTPRCAVAKFFGMRPLAKEALSWYLGALGERKTGLILAQLDPEWRVLHSVPVGTRGSDIDHIVIGPTGIHLVNSKNHADARVWVGKSAMMVAGQRVPYLRNSRHEVASVRKYLTQVLGDERGAALPIEGVVALWCKQLTLKQAPDGVTTIYASSLSRHLRGKLRRANARARRERATADATSSRLLTADERLAVFEELSRPGGLGVHDAVDAEEVHRVVREFEFLDREVRMACALRILWFMVVLISVLAAGVFILSRVAPWWGVSAL